MTRPKICLACNPTDHESHEMKNPLCGQHVLSQSIELKHKLKHLKKRIADELNMAWNKPEWINMYVRYLHISFLLSGSKISLEQ